MVATNDGPSSGITADGNRWELRRRIRQFLMRRGIRGLDTICIDVDGGTVVLRGRIASRHDRWRCHACACHVAGVLRVVDELQVDDDDRPPKSRRHPYATRVEGRNSI